MARLRAGPCPIRLWKTWEKSQSFPSFRRGFVVFLPHMARQYLMTGSVGRKRRRSMSPYDRERYDPRPRYDDYRLLLMSSLVSSFVSQHHSQILIRVMDTPRLRVDTQGLTHQLEEEWRLLTPTLLTIQRPWNNMQTGFAITSLLKQLRKTMPTKLQNKKPETVPNLAMV